MQNIFQNYIFWLAVISLLCLLLERVAPWRKNQKLWRSEIVQDYFWLVFNGWGAGIVFGGAFVFINAYLDTGFFLVFHKNAGTFNIISSLPLYIQVIIFLVTADFIEWCVHNALHRVGWLWQIHRVHHSIQIMDWIGNFRFHWGELFVYKILKYLPMAIIGARFEAVLICSVIATLIGHLNHSNLNISWGPFRYILNSPRMHIWHHERELRGKAGVNFAIVFSLWDWIFSTAYMPKEVLQPAQIGFMGNKNVSHNILMRFFLPFIDRN